MSFSDFDHYELARTSELGRMPKVLPKLAEACFLGADPSGLYRA